MNRVGGAATERLPKENLLRFAAFFWWILAFAGGAIFVIFFEEIFLWGLSSFSGSTLYVIGFFSVILQLFPIAVGLYLFHQMSEIERRVDRLYKAGVLDQFSEA
ncbi:MAG: hypothetical protein AAF570_12075 [Bacteroidota bacterium]